MKIYISTDIEGIGCVVRGEHFMIEGRDYPEARRLMTEEVNAAVAGAFDAGAREAVVCDAHNVGLNLLPELLDDRATLIMGGPRPLSMMEGIHMGFDAVFLVGYHAMSGTADSTIVHIISSRVAEVRINGVRMGEIGLSAMVAGHFDVPVALVTSDDAGASEARDLLETAETVAVKQGIGAYAAHCLHPATCRRMIRAAAAKALTRIDRFVPLAVEGPILLEMCFTTVAGADQALRMPGAERTDGLTVRWQADDALDAYRAVIAMAALAGAAPFF